MGWDGLGWVGMGWAGVLNGWTSGRIEGRGRGRGRGEFWCRGLFQISIGSDRGLWYPAESWLSSPSNDFRHLLDSGKSQI